MVLTEETFKLYAAKFYDNPYCFNESEFEEDLARISTIKRIISWDLSGYSELNIRLFINNIISFYNVFKHKQASELLEFRLDNKEQIKVCNSALYYLNLPLMGSKEYDIIVHRKIAKEINENV